MINTTLISKYTKYLTIYSILIIGSYSCSKNEPVKEEVTIDQILGEEEKTDDTIVEYESIPELDGTFTSELNQKLYKKFRSKAHQQSTLIDRFSSVSIEKTTFVPFDDSLASAHFFMYNFSDTAATNNAFNNWLACFGSDCEEISLNENKNRVRENALWCGVYDQSIIIIKFTPKSLEFKSELKQSVFQTKGEALKYTLNVTADNQLKWD